MINKAEVTESNFECDVGLVTTSQVLTAKGYIEARLLDH